MHLRPAQMTLESLPVWSQRISSGGLAYALALLGGKVHTCWFTRLVLVVVDPRGALAAQEGMLLLKRLLPFSSAFVMLVKQKPSFPGKTVHHFPESLLALEVGACDLISKLVCCVAACVLCQCMHLVKLGFRFHDVFILGLGVEARDLVVLSRTAAPFARCCWGIGVVMFLPRNCWNCKSVHPDRPATSESRTGYSPFRSTCGIVHREHWKIPSAKAWFLGSYGTESEDTEFGPDVLSRRCPQLTKSVFIML